MPDVHTLNDDGDRVQISSTIYAETVHRRMLRLTWRKAGTQRWYHRLFGIVPDNTQTIVLTKADIRKLASIEW